MLDALADGIKMAELELGFGVAVIGGLAIPRGGLRVAQWDALANVVELSQLLLGFGKFWVAASRYQWAASLSLCETPSPLRYISPRLYCAQARLL
jgi:hypothetical protein